MRRMSEMTETERKSAAEQYDRSEGRSRRAEKKDFSKGSILGNMIRLAVPMTMAQLINVLYNIVDRIYIGRIPENATMSLTGLGVCFPIITMVIAFANLVGMGGAPLFSIERGKGNEDEAEWILGNSFTLLLLFGLLLTGIVWIFKEPLLWLMGASEVTMPYADAYLSVYLLGTVFVMISLGLNSFINAQGFAGIGMLTVAIGAVLNLILDPIFIFTFHMGVQGAALATILSQFVSAVWTVCFLTGRHTLLRLKKETMRLNAKRVKNILVLGMSGFIMSVTNSLVQMVNNMALQSWGGDIYVAVITVINSVREVVQMPVSGISNSSHPILSFNYGAREYDRVRQTIRYLAVMLIGYTLAAWAFVSAFPEFCISVFNQDAELLEVGVPSLHIYFFGFFMMALQFTGQNVFQALGYAKRAIFFSVFRKIIVVIPLILLLPGLGFGVQGVFLAEPISNFLGGIVCFVTMILTVYRKLS